MPFDVLLGLQWGDEGKSKIIDLLAKDYDAIVRFQGGDNAGHTIIYNNEKIVLHHIPSGIFYPQKTCILGNGMVINPISLHKEMSDLKTKGCTFRNRLFISNNAKLILPIHKRLDVLRDKSDKIGTTKKGIGPAYEDAKGRRNLKFGDLFLSDLKEKMAQLYRFHNSIEEVDADYKTVEPLIEYFAEYNSDTTNLVNKLLLEKKEILLEGAQGSLLDIDFGTYPFVTSSNTTIGGVFIGTGINPRYLRDVFGIIKAYTTRVGNGDFPTELTGKTSDFLVEKGQEFGSTTGRKRRTGWLDLCAVNYAIMISGVSKLIVTKLDILSGLENVEICTNYLSNGKKINYPSNFDQISDFKTDYISLEGWNQDISKVNNFDDLDSKVIEFIKTVEGQTNTEVMLVSVGPGRENVFQL